MIRTFKIYSVSNFYFFKDFIYLTERDTAREGTQAGGAGEGEEGSPLSRDPNAGLDPRTLGLRPEPKADTSLTEPPQVPLLATFKYAVQHTL